MQVEGKKIKVEASIVLKDTYGLPTVPIYPVTGEKILLLDLKLSYSKYEILTRVDFLLGGN